MYSLYLWSSFLVKRNYIDIHNNIHNKEREIDHKLQEKEHELQKITQELQEIKPKLHSMRLAQKIGVEPELYKIRKDFYYSNVDLDKIRETKKVEEQEVLNILAMFVPYDVEGISLMRMGGDFDGGYLVPKEAMLDSEFCVSGGIAGDTSFEEDLLKVKDLIIYSFDHTVKDLPLRDKSLQNHFIHTQAALVGKDKQLNDNFTHSLTLQDVFKTHNLHNKRGCLKIDIEGSEFDFLEHATVELMEHFTCIVVEIHGLSDYYILKRAGTILARILKQFTLIHVHANSVCGYGYLLEHRGISYGNVMECTFINNAYVTHKTPVKKLPHELDAQNVEGYPELETNYWMPEYNIDNLDS